jgi:hypothetical protein
MQPQKVPVGTKMWTVYDSNAKLGEIRHHEIMIRQIPGHPPETKTFGLSSTEPCEMTSDDARKFLKDRAFIVINEKGVRQEVIEERDDGTIKLSANEIIAEYQELTKEALFNRVKMCANSAHIKYGDTEKDEMIAFLRNERAAKEKAGEQPSIIDSGRDPSLADAAVVAGMETMGDEASNLFQGAQSALDEVTPGR